MNENGIALANGALEEQDYDSPKAHRLPALGLESHHGSFQVDGFNRALQRNSTSSGKLARFLSLGKTSPEHRKNATGGWDSSISLDDMLLHSVDPIPTSLLKMPNDQATKAVKMFNSLLKFTGDASFDVSDVQQMEIAQKLLHNGLKRAEMKDELYMQLLKQTRGNPNFESKLRAWQLFHLVASTMPPSKDYVGLVSQYIHSVCHEDSEPEETRQIATHTWNALKRSAKAGARRSLPTVEEIEALLSRRKLKTIIFFLDETFEELEYDVTTTVLESVEQIAGLIGLQNHTTFTLFECRRSQQKAMDTAMDEHTLLDDHKYIADVLADFQNRKAEKDTTQSRLLFKKRMFRETDEAIQEPQFLNLSYVQAQHDFLLGNYPVVREDAAQMCALQILAEYGPKLKPEDRAIPRAIEKYMSRQFLMTRPREDWKLDVMSRYNALSQYTKEDARMQFLRVLRSLPYGNSVFFHVKRIEDPIGLLPAKLILGINKRGVHFFRPVPKEYLHSAELRDIMQFGSSSQAVFFKMRVAGVLHIFQFETKQGEDICMALQTHINDIMMKRYAKAKAMAVAEARSSTVLPTANFGAKYEQHISQMQKMLNDSQAKVEELTQREEELRYEQDRLNDRLEETVEKTMDVEESKNEQQENAFRLQRQIDKMRAEYDEISAAVAAAEHVRAGLVSKQSVDSLKVKELKIILEQKTNEVEEASTRAVSLEKECQKMQKGKELTEKKMNRIDKTKESETRALKEQVESATGQLRDQLHSKDMKINDYMEQLANVTAMFNENKSELEQIQTDKEELAELLAMKVEIESKDRANAHTIEAQARKLDRVEKVYKEEQLLRKRIFNHMEDMKGKIRVYARVRPMLGLEYEKGQCVALAIPDELTVSHYWRNEAKPREYSFDSVFDPDATQEDVFEDTKHLIQSAVDGYNVCIFAYGQTGSGKTYTIYGNEHSPGLTPRGIYELFSIFDRDSGKYSFDVSCYMLELYQDTLMDLLSTAKSSKFGPAGSGKEVPKLEIKRDVKGMVSVQGVTRVNVTSPEELMQTIEDGQNRRHVASTQMNRESSRSHLIMSIIIQSTNLQTQAVTRGKLSFVDLAGSERVKKSGSTGEQLKEAQAINKSLSALGDVISALATDSPHIPYRNHKLTMLMSDSLGGNAKTLMFVNVSPTDQNLDETQNSLLYATRVRTIKNDPNKDETNREITRLKRHIDYWKQQAQMPGSDRDVDALTAALQGGE
ncbi:unnamed protein product [Ostreobium quekettii]|uniref:Kinesin-like calmodulin-binding protein n=1 Tax=Ostreobium quekettii TaxID=121088 RepID=A0A8S1JAA5_9CHLO|nr:unnamed protein product [Ostreobium quekettii]